MIRRISIASIIVALQISLNFVKAQVNTPPAPVYTNEFSMGFQLHPRGLGLNMHFAKKKAKHWRTLDFDVLTMKHPKEFKIRSNFNPPGVYTYGKLNYLYLLRTGVGVKKELSGKFYKNTIGTAIQFSAGPVFGFLKPVYLDIFYPYPDSPEGFRVPERYDPEKHRQEDIVGASNFNTGIGQTKTKMGLFVKGSVHFDWSDFSDQLQSVELGVALDAFPQELPLMAFVQNKFLFSSMYICINFGNRR